ncbi:hypothetical protein LAJ19_07615 [Deinococcus taeanensis]|uniref:hypothetical protein n=1 Tax=Deinococcus taeanensis TaxID=2737050 RepID=UPI001CDB5F68|nr:hypothetical protein [Deinococcus taeanensis]UBV41534.1 hypothetical protein LAJ19_07615 [Deinococcus taeanensis]
MASSSRHAAFRFALLGTLLSGAAHAATLNFGVAYARPAEPWTWSTWGTLGVSDLDALGGTVSAGVSTRAFTVTYARGLSLPPLAAVNARTALTVTGQGGVHLDTRVSGSAGPVAVTGGAAFFTVPVTAADPLATFALAPADLRPSGRSGDLTVRYRVNRDLVAVLGGEFGAQDHALLGVEGRRVLTRALPPEEEDGEGAPAGDADPAAHEAEAPAVEGDLPEPTGPEAPVEAGPAEPETEPVGTLSWRLGARAGRDMLAATGGVGYATPAGLSLNLDALIGVSDWTTAATFDARRSWGVTGSVGALDVLGEGSSVRVYAAYEPWRLASAPLRAGAEATLVAGPGNVTLNVNGGRTLTGQTGFGVRVSYALPLAPSPK